MVRGLWVQRYVNPYGDKSLAQSMSEKWLVEDLLFQPTARGTTVGHEMNKNQLVSLSG
jgi:hypothetical protein